MRGLWKAALALTAFACLAGWATASEQAPPSSAAAGQSGTTMGVPREVLETLLNQNQQAKGEPAKPATPAPTPTPRAYLSPAGQASVYTERCPDYRSEAFGPLKKCRCGQAVYYTNLGCQCPSCVVARLAAEANGDGTP